MSYSFSSTSLVSEKPKSPSNDRPSRSHLTALTIAALTVTASLPAGATSSQWPQSPMTLTTSPMYFERNAATGTTTRAAPHVVRDSNKHLTSITSLRELSGLTTDQISRLFGVSRRSIQNWVAGASMSSANEERLSGLIGVVLAVGSTPEERRRKLLDSSDGISMFHALIGQLADPKILQPNPFSVHSQFSA